jgi:hypothetical protein
MQNARLLSFPDTGLPEGGTVSLSWALVTTKRSFESTVMDDISALLVHAKD